MFLNVQFEFLQKKTTTSRTLEAGIIKPWKKYCKRKLLRHVASEIDGKKTASLTVKSVNLLMKSAWEEVPSHVGMYSHEEMDDDQFADDNTENHLKNCIIKTPRTSVRQRKRNFSLMSNRHRHEKFLGAKRQKKKNTADELGYKMVRTLNYAHLHVYARFETNVYGCRYIKNTIFR